jgi:putative nucleotidyltransferase with HDIG domain
MGQTSASYRKEILELDHSISLSEIISALSFAIELTDGTMHGHAMRSCVLGLRIAEEAGFTAAEKSSLYYALLLKDIGNEEMIGLRCDRGASIISKLGMGQLAADAVRSLEAHWDGSGYPNQMRGEEIPRLGRLCAIAQHLDMFSIGRNPGIAIETMKDWSGSWFDPELVKVALALNRRDALWTHCRAADSHEATRGAVLDFDPRSSQPLDDDQVDRICEAFAEVVDAKSHFTFRHSQGVAELARGIAENLRLPADRVQLVWRAALLHDLGKLSVSNRILDKRTQLTETEWAVVKRHPGLTRKILEQIGPFQEIAIVAGEHHEKLDGSGYPNHLRARDLSIESRIVAVADIYGALSEDRPYREGLSYEEILPILNSLGQGKLDQECIGALLMYLDDFYPRDISPEMGISGRLTQFCA